MPQADDVLAESPDVVIIATGGLPNTEILDSGNELVVSTWDVMSGQVKPAGRALVFDDNGNHPAMQAAELLAEAGSAVEIVSPERFFAPEMGGLNHALYARAFHRARRARHHQRAAALGSPRRQRAGRRRSAATTARGTRSAASIRSWSNTARCRPTTSITR